MFSYIVSLFQMYLPWHIIHQSTGRFNSFIETDMQADTQIKRCIGSCLGLILINPYDRLNFAYNVPLFCINNSEMFVFR